MACSNMREKFKNMDQKTKLKVYLVGLPLLAVFVWLGQLITGAIMARESAALLSSFAVVGTIVVFIALLASFILTGSLILVGHADAKGDYKQVGKLIVYASLTGLFVGFLGMTYVLVDSNSLLEAFDPKGQLVNETQVTLYIFSAGFPFVVYCYGVAGGLISLLLFPPVIAAGAVAGVAFFFLSYPLFFAGVGLPAFGIGFDSAALSFAVVISVSLYSSQERRLKYQFPFCSPPREDHASNPASDAVHVHADKSVREFVCEFLGSFGMLAVRSIVTQMQNLLSILFITRIGVVPLAVYALLANLRAITLNLMVVCTFIINFVGSRVYGAGDADHLEADFRGFLAVAKFSAFFITLVGVAFGVAYSILAKGLVLRQASDDEKDEYEALLTPTLILLFAIVQLAAPVAGVHESILMTAKDFNFIGGQISIAFFCGYIPFLIAGSQQESLTLIFAGDCLYFLIRAVLSCGRWYFSLKRGLVARTNELEAREGKRNRKDTAINLICCGHGQDDWNAIVTALTREEVPAATRNPTNASL